MSPAFPFSLALYAAACALYLSQIVSPQGPSSPGVARLISVARAVLTLAFCAHAVDIGLLCVRGAHPFINAREALSFIAWLTVGAYLLVNLRVSLPLAGALIVPVTLVLNLAAHLGPSPVSPDHAQTLLATLHIGLATAGIAAFAIAAGDSAVYLVAEGRLKGRRPVPAGPVGEPRRRAFPLDSLPPLETLDKLNRRCIELGFPLFTVAMVTGAIWLMRLPSMPSSLPSSFSLSLASSSAHRLLQPQYALSVVAWAIYAGLLLLRITAGLRGRRAAIVTLGGFAASLGVLVSYYMRGLLGGA